jgi:hypothetical protein
MSYLIKVVTLSLFLSDIELKEPIYSYMGNGMVKASTDGWVFTVQHQLKLRCTSKSKSVMATIS